MLNLVIDTSSAVATAVVADDDAVLAVRSERGSTLSLVHDLVRSALADADRRLLDLDMIACVRGPGSWTGLHVGVTTAKTLAQVADKPVLGISMLDCLARTAPIDPATVCALLDAKHDAYYSAVYDVASGPLRPLADARRRSVSELAAELARVGGKIAVVGGVAEASFTVLAQQGAELIRMTESYPSPEAFATVALDNSAAALRGDDRYGLAPDYMQDDFTITARK
jgi:tRNA threonylcarbamoyladenosine biosynthesis protein TsaB